MEGCISVGGRRGRALWLANGKEAHDHLLEGQKFCLYETGDILKRPKDDLFQFQTPLCVLAEIQYCTVSVLQVVISHSSCQALCQGLRTQTNPKVLVWEPQICKCHTTVQVTAERCQCREEGRQSNHWDRESGWRWRLGWPLKDWQEAVLIEEEPQTKRRTGESLWLPSLSAHYSWEGERWSWEAWWPHPVVQGLRLYSGGDGDLLLAFKQEGDLVAFEAW